MDRRRFMKTSSTTVGTLLLPLLPSRGEAIRNSRPRLYVTAEKIDGLRSLDEVRRGLGSGHAAKLWSELWEKVHEEMAEDVWTPTTPHPDREEKHIERANREYTIVAVTANRILDTSLAALVTGEQRYVDAALRQIEALFDPNLWPEWTDKAHVATGLTIDLRHGQLAFAVGVAYDWLSSLLSAKERRRFLEGFDRCAIQPYKEGVEADERWTRSTNNWLTSVVGGFAVAGMALAEDHPDSEWLVEYAKPKLEDYMNVFGEEGEFNESVQYAGSTSLVVRYFMAQRYASGGADNPFERHSLADFARWYLYFTFPPGRVAGFGDPSPNLPPCVFHLSALASALGDPVVQWFYLQYFDAMLPRVRQRALELLYYDPTLDALSPEGRLPLGRAYRDEDMLMSSRDSWDPEVTTSVVSAKAGQAASHTHADWGQVCIDGYGERLIVDLGSTKGYPNWSDRKHYYNFQQWGHNVFVFGQNETGGVPLGKPHREGRIVRAEFDDHRGTVWSVDLTEVYNTPPEIKGEVSPLAVPVEKVTRTVIHFLPRVVAVLDDAVLTTPQPIRLRWHTVTPPVLSNKGRFAVQGTDAALSACVTSLDGEVEIGVGRHEYREPYDKDRLGEPYTQVHEPFVEVKTTGQRCRVLSLFCVLPSSEDQPSWEVGDGGWSIAASEGNVRVTCDEQRLVVAGEASGQKWEVTF